MINIIKEETVHFIERFYSYNPDVGYSIDSDICPIVERNPLIFINDSSMCLGFRFFDSTRRTSSNGQSFWSKPSNYSGMYYYGKRLTEAELLDVYEYMPYYRNIKSMILCEYGGLITNINDHDITVEEYKNTILEVKQASIKLERKL